MCFSYMTFLRCENCNEKIPGSQGYYNVPEHTPACKPMRSGHYEVRDAPKYTKNLTGGSGRVEGWGKMSGCLECAIVFNQEEREAEEVKAKTKAKA